jgi:gluconolactonase
MMYLETPPRLIETHVFSTMPVAFRRKGVATSWADANRPGHDTDSFIEGPSFDAEGNLHVVDIPFGRIFEIAPGGEWSLVIAYEAGPTDLKSPRTDVLWSPIPSTGSWNSMRRRDRCSPC